MEKATFAGGCFWCTEAIFKRLKGVIKVFPGYSGGHVENPTYDEVCSETTGHAEAIQIEFDPKVISYELLLEIFFYTHDPTTPNQQGNDIGPQYRSVVFYHSEEQRLTAEKTIKKLESENIFRKPIVTTIEKFSNFYVAEDYHKNYYDRNMNNLYCSITISPKIKKLLEKYNQNVKKEYRND
jgi:peptide-methionine (S)-S-oxide reductase